jgi:hypothetical protein
MRGSEYTSASVIFNIGVGGLKSIGKIVGSDVVVFDSGVFDEMVAHGMKWLGGCTGTPHVLVEAAGILKDGGMGEEEVGDGGGTPSLGMEGLKLEGVKLELESMKVPPSSPVRGAGGGRGGGDGGDGKVFFEDSSSGGEGEEAIFACQPMWCYKRCNHCGLAPLDEEILAGWENVKERVLSACEMVRRRAGISGDGRRARRRRRTYESDQALGDVAVEAAKEAAREALKDFSKEGVGKGNALSMDVTVKIPCPNCRLGARRAKR